MTTAKQELSGAIGSDITSDFITQSYTKHQAAIIFYSDAALTNVVGKETMSGHVDFAASETGEEYALMSDGRLTLGSSTYARPNAVGSYRYIKATFSNITGATHFKLIISSFAG